MENTVGELLVKKRSELGLTQAALASIIGVQQSTLSAWENNEFCPSTPNVESISKVFRVSRESVLDSIVYTKAAKLGLFNEGDIEACIEIVNLAAENDLLPVTLKEVMYVLDSTKGYPFIKSDFVRGFILLERTFSDIKSN